MIKKLIIFLALLLCGVPNIVSLLFDFAQGSEFLELSNYAFAQSVDTAWVRRYDGPGNSDDEAYAMVLDDSGNVYVTGWSRGTVTLWDIASIKYYPNGDTAWVRRYNGPGDSDDGAYAIAVDDSGNIYMTGRSVGSGTSEDYATVKYYPNGDTAWTRRYNGPGNGIDVAKALAVDSSGNVYVTGRSNNIGTYFDYTTIKYYSNGDTAWVRRYNGPGNWDDWANTIAVDGSNNVYVAGLSMGSGLDEDYATIKYKYIQYRHGDANGDGKFTVSDVVYIINYLFKGGTPPNPLWTGDTNCDDKVMVSDVIYLVNYLFKGGPEPCI